MTARRTVRSVIEARRAERADQGRYRTDTEMQRSRLRRAASRGDEDALAALAAYEAQQSDDTTPTK